MTDKFLTQRQLDEYVEDLETLLKNTKKMADNEALFGVLVSKNVPQSQSVSMIRDLQLIQWSLDQAKRHATSLTEQVTSTEIIK